FVLHGLRSLAPKTVIEHRLFITLSRDGDDLAATACSLGQDTAGRSACPTLQTLLLEAGHNFDVNPSSTLAAKRRPSRSSRVSRATPQGNRNWVIACSLET